MEHLDKAMPMLERAMGMCRALDAPLYFGVIATPLGEACTLSGRLDDAVSLLEEAIERADAIARGTYQSRALALLSQAMLLSGQLEEAIPLTERALEHSRTYKERGYQAYTLHLLGDIAMHRHPPTIDQAEAHYQQALSLAEELGMRPLQAHCHSSLGTLYSLARRVEPARANLSMAIEMYRDMHMTLWLPQVEALLAQDYS